MVGVSFMIIVICYTVSAVNSEEAYETSCIHLDVYVDCASKKLVAVPKNIPIWTTRLVLNNNYIRILEGEALRNLSQLVELRVNKNKIQNITMNSFSNKKQLKILEMNRNRIENIESLSLKPLERVVVLKLRRNRIQKLNDGSFFGLTKIKSLLLDYNFIQSIRKGWLYNLENLTELSLSNNKIQTIDNDAWEFCKQLSELDLSHNLLKSIGRETLKDLVFLQKLLLNDNEIMFIEENAFSNTPNLKLLNLSNNKISWTIEDANSVFRGLSNLLKFDVSSNDIKSINKNAFTGLSKVKYLHLQNNNITTVQRNAFAEMPLLEDLVLSTNSLLCDCNLQWFAEYLAQRKLNVTTICAYPNWLRELPLQAVPPNNFTCDGLPKPRLIEEPEVEIMALKGENISLTCKAMSSSSKPMTFQWKKDNIELTNADYSTKSTPIGKNTETLSFLNITRVQHSDAGKYQCVVSNSYGTTYSQKSSISVLIYPTFRKMPSNITVEAGTTARLDCSASGEPPPEIAWQKDGGNDFPAATERRMQVMRGDDVFFIINSKPSDMGVYSCTAHNAAGTIVANATLTIEEKPSFVKPMEDKEVTAGESVVIQCMASGSPKPTIQWMKDGQPINATERHFFTAEDQLMIIVDTLLSDGGIYTCKLNNSLGLETGYSILTVKPVLMSPSDMLGIIIITVVSCAVFTSGVWVVIIYQTRRRMGPMAAIKAPTEPMMLEFQDKLNHFRDNTSEHSSCKDSGTGDSAKRSNDDLLPVDEFTLIINDTVPTDKNTTMRAASLLYLPAVDSIIHSDTPLLNTDVTPYQRSTNHDRLDEAEQVDQVAQVTNAVVPEAVSNV